MGKVGDRVDYVRVIIFLLFAGIAPLLLGQSCKISPLLPLNFPPNIDGEPVDSSRTLGLGAPIPGPGGILYFYDSYFRLRRMNPDRSLTTVVGNSVNRRLAASSIARVSRDGLLHLAMEQRVFQLRGRDLVPIAGSGNPEFNGASGTALSLSLGNIRDITFDRNGGLLILDGFGLLRRLGMDGMLRTIAGSMRQPTEVVPQEVPALDAHLGVASRILAAADGSVYVIGSGIVQPNGIFRRPDFPAIWPEFVMPDGTPVRQEGMDIVPIGNSSSPIFSGYSGRPVGITPAGELLLYQSSQENSRLSLFKSGITIPVAAYDRASSTTPSAERIAWDRDSSTALIGVFDNLSELREGRVVVRAPIDVNSPFALGPNGNVFAFQKFGLVSIDRAGKATPVSTPRGPIVDGPNISTPRVLSPTMVWSSAGYLYWHTTRDTVSVWHESTKTSAGISAFDTVFLMKLADGTAGAWQGNMARVKPNVLRRLVSASISAEVRVPGLLRADSKQGVMAEELSLFITPTGQLIRASETGSHLLTLAELDLPFPIEFVAVDSIPGGAVLIGRINSEQIFLRVDGIADCDGIPVPSIAPGGAVNAASYEYGSEISSNSLLSVFGSNLTSEMSFSLPVLYTTPGQLLIQVPVFCEPPNCFQNESYFLRWRWRGITFFDSNELKIRPATPGLFTSNGTGEGLAAALNQDGSVNSAANPAPAGSVIQLYGTGFGPTNPISATGATFPTTELSPLSNSATIRIGGLAGDILFAGGAPGQSSGVYQVNARIPPQSEPGARIIQLSIAGHAATSRKPVFIYVR